MISLKESGGIIGGITGGGGGGGGGFFGTGGLLSGASNMLSGGHNNHQQQQQQNNQQQQHQQPQQNQQQQQNVWTIKQLRVCTLDQYVGFLDIFFSVISVLFLQITDMLFYQKLIATLDFKIVEQLESFKSVINFGHTKNSLLITRIYWLLLIIDQWEYKQNFCIRQTAFCLLNHCILR